MLAYVNGHICPPSEAHISPFDRGYLFADGVYEALRVTRAAGPAPHPPAPRIIGERRHLRRLARSLAELSIDWPAEGMAAITRELINHSRLDEALIYFQVTRGVPDLTAPPLRSHLPPAGIKPSVFAFIRAMPRLDVTDATPASKRCVTTTDTRWLRCDIKSISLLGNVMASMDAAARGGTEALLLRETPSGRVASEGSLTNLAIVRADGVLITPSLQSASLLPGITRELLLDHDATLTQGTVTEHDLRTAREVMLLGTTASVTAVTHVDDQPIGTAQPGEHTRRLNQLLLRLIAEGREDC